MPDPADESDKFIDAARNSEVARILQLAQRKAPVSPECEECGFDVEKGRLELGYSTCLECQTVLEARNKHRRRA